MSVEPIGPGDLLERVRPSLFWPGFVVGGFYRVREVKNQPGSCDGCRGHSGVLLCDAPDPEAVGRLGCSWCLCGFRPISRRSDFERFLTEVTAPRDDVDESADQPAKREPEPAR